MTNKIYTEREQADLNLFTWNPKCNEDQISRMAAMRAEGGKLCEFMIRNVQDCADRSAAIRDLRTAIMQCNLAIAHEKQGKF